MAEYIKKEDLLDAAYWHGDKYTVQNPYPSGVEAVDVEDIEKMETIDIEEIKRMAVEALEKQEHETQEKPFPFVVGQPAEMFLDGKWEKGKIVAGYRFNDGVVTIETEDGRRLWCGQDRTDIYRPYQEEQDG